MLPASIYSFSLAAFVALTFSSAIPASSPRTPASISPLDVNQAANGFTVLPFASTWSLPSAAPNASFEETEQEFRQLKDFKPPKCDAALYGRALQVESCRDAQKMIPTDRRPLLFGIRNRGRWNVNLPYRWSSCSLAVDYPKSLVVHCADQSHRSQPTVSASLRLALPLSESPTKRPGSKSLTQLGLSSIHV